MTDTRRRPPPSPPVAGPPPPRLLERVRLSIRARHYSRRTEKAYVAWIRRFILFHGKRHPDGLGAPEVDGLPVPPRRRAGRSAPPPRTRPSARILFLYRDVLGRELAGLEDVPRARRPERLPVVLAREEVHAVLRQHAAARRGSCAR